VCLKWSVPNRFQAPLVPMKHKWSTALRAVAGKSFVFKERETGIEPATSSLGI